MQTKFYKISYDKVFKAIETALENLEVRIEESNYKEGGIIAITGTSWWSWGEEIQIGLTKKQNGTEITVESKSMAQLISWGKNSDNEKEIIEEVRNILSVR